MVLRAALRYTAIITAFAICLLPPALLSNKILRILLKISIALLSTHYIAFALYLQYSKSYDDHSVYSISVWISMFWLAVMNSVTSIQLIRNTSNMSCLIQSVLHYYDDENKQFAKSTVGLVALATLECIAIFICKYFLSGSPITFVTRSTITLLSMFILIWEAKTRLKDLNNDLKECGKDREVLEVRRRHNQTCNMIVYINKLYGLVVLMAVMSCTIEICHTAFSMLSPYAIYVKQRPGLQHYILYINFIIHVVLIAVGGEMVKREAENTLSVCYAQLQRYPPHKGDKEMTKQLLILTQQAFQRKPHISASGFFPIDHSLIMFICTNSSTYLIFLCQFITKPTQTSPGIDIVGLSNVTNVTLG